MTRVSLKEAYDNKDVVAQIYAIRDIAEGAENNANSALSTANTASEHVDALVPQVEGAVQNANNASASAQQSANTVTTYDTRLSAAESKNSQQDTAISELQTADEQNVKINAVNQYAVGLTGNQNNIAGTKIFLSECTGTAYFGLTNKRASFTIDDRSGKNRAWFRLLEDSNSATLISGFYDINQDGTNQFIVSMNVDVGGTTKTIELIRVLTDASGKVTTASIGGKVIP